MLPLCFQCVMCFRTASSQQLERARILNEGIILLGVPALLILSGFIYLIYRCVNSQDDQYDGYDKRNTLE
jgi:hypothetical protein